MDIQSPSLASPIIHWEQITIPATTYVQQSDPTTFINPTEKDMEIHHICLDDEGNNIQLRMGRLGGKSINETYAHMRSFHNTRIMSRTVDGGYPLLKLPRPIRLAANKGLTVRLQDTVAGGARLANVILIGYNPKTGMPFFPADRVSIPSGGQVAAQVQNQQDTEIVCGGLQIYMEEVGTAALQRGLRVKVEGGGLPDWSQTLVPASVHFPHRNAAASVWTPQRPIILKPGEAWMFDLLDTTGAAVTATVSTIGLYQDVKG